MTNLGSFLIMQTYGIFSVEVVVQMPKNLHNILGGVEGRPFLHGLFKNAFQSFKEKSDFWSQRNPS